MRGTIHAMVALLFLSGCTTVKYVPCPVITPYSKQDQQGLAQELRDHPSEIVSRVISDYIGLRDQVRACKETVK